MLFALGVHAADRGWLAALTPALARRLGWIALADAIATVTLFTVLEKQDEAAAVLNAATGWPAMLLALLDGTVAVTWALKRCLPGCHVRRQSTWRCQVP